MESADSNCPMDFERQFQRYLDSGKAVGRVGVGRGAARDGKAPEARGPRIRFRWKEERHLYPLIDLGWILVHI